MGPTALLPLTKEGVLRNFFALKNTTALAECEPANLGTKGQHATSRPPKPLLTGYFCLNRVLHGGIQQLIIKWIIAFHVILTN